MKESFGPMIRCPACSAMGLTIAATQRDAREVRSGTATCTGCARPFPITDGILDLLTDFAGEEILEEQQFNDPSKFSPDEAGIFLRDEYLLGLPEGGWHAKMPNHWRFNGLNFYDILERAGLEPGARVLDLGTGTCWTTRRLAQRGYECVALDIARQRHIGLGSAEVYFEADGTYFERVLGNLSDPPFADASFDGIFANAAVHHVSDLAATFRHFARLLKPGGVVALANEPVGGITKKILKDPVMKDALAEGANEHIYSVFAWTRAARAAGLAPNPYLPRESTLFKLKKIGIAAALMKMPGVEHAAWLSLRAVLWPILIVRGVGINLLFRKPTQG